jgi:DNA repair protein RecO (recombination protein O)
METRVTDQAAFILRRRDWRNSSLMLDLFTCEFGRLRAIARGAKRSPARASYRPFELLSVSWSGRQELKTLTAIEGHALAVDERNYLALLYVNDLIGAILPERDASPEIFAGYLSLLQDAAGPLDEARLRRFELELLRLLGYIPDFTTDARNGQPIRPDRHYQFVIGNGFVACAASDPNSVGGSTVIDWNEGRYRHDPVLRLAKSVLRSTIDFNLHGKKLKSRDVYQEMAKRK